VTLAHPTPFRRSARPKPTRPSFPIEELDRRVLLSAALLATSPAIPRPAPHAAVVAAAHATAEVPVSQVPLLHSRPAAAAKIYLDFDGDVTPDWGPYHPGATPAYSTDLDVTTFTDAELANINEIWTRVADVYSPFNVDVTTQDPGNLDDLRTTRVVIGGAGDWYGTAGGVAYLGAFQNTAPNTAWVFPDHLGNGYAKYVADATSHEAGHTFNLNHQSTFTGTTKDQEYNTGTSLTGPVMGVGYYSARTLWWRGTPDYNSAGVQDDLDVLSGAANGFGYRADDRGDTPAGAAPLSAGTTATGLIERPADTDYYKLTLPAAGTLTLTGGVPGFARMLDPVVELRDASGNLMSAADGGFLSDGTYQGDVITANLAAGTYYVSVRGHGLVSTAAQPGAAANLGSFYDVGQYTLTTAFSATPTQQPYPDPNTPLAIRSTGNSVLQAENFDTGGEGVAYHDAESQNLGGAYRPGEGVDIETTTDAGGGFGVGYVRAGEWLEYTVDVARSDVPFQVGLRLAAPQSGATMHLELDGANVTGSLAVPNTGGWQTWQTLTKTGVALAPGRHVLRVVFDRAGANGYVANLNSITFAPDVSPTQKPYTGTPWAVGQQVEAENFDTGGEGVAYHDAEAKNLPGLYRPADGVDIETTTDTGGGYDVGYARAGEWLEYTVNFPTAGLYDLAVRLANSDSGAKFHAELDGANVTGSIDIPNTGGYQTWRTLTKTVQADAGVHVLRIALDAAAPTGYAGNLNWFKITPAANASKVVVQAEDYLPGGEGVAYHDTESQNLGGAYRPTDGVDIETTTDTGGGFNVGYVKAGEWLQYGFDLDQGGTWQLDFRLASAYPGGKFHVELDGAANPTTITVPNTGGWQTWQTLAATNLSLAGGHHTLRLVMDQNTSSGYVGNFNYFSLTRIA
jgi:hypothetical protein